MLDKLTQTRAVRVQETLFAWKTVDFYGTSFRGTNLAISVLRITEYTSQPQSLSANRGTHKFYGHLQHNDRDAASRFEISFVCTRHELFCIS